MPPAVSPASSSPVSLIARLEAVSKLYGNFAALKQVTLALERGRCYVLLGENGAGKSTLLRILAGLLQPTYGQAFFFDESAHESVFKSQRERIGYMSHAPMMYDELSALENLSYFAGLYRGGPCLTSADALKAVGLDPQLARPFGQYSQGMRQRASLARVLLPQPEFLLLDEPFSNMDANSAAQMLSLLAELRGQGRSILLTTHQRDLAAPLADYFVTMQDGRVTAVEPGPALNQVPKPAAVSTQLFTPNEGAR